MLQEGMENNHFVQTIIISIVKVPPMSLLISAGSCCHCPVKIAVPARQRTCTEPGHSDADIPEKSIPGGCTRKHVPTIPGCERRVHLSYSYKAWVMAGSVIDACVTCRSVSESLPLVWR